LADFCKLRHQSGCGGDDGDDDDGGVVGNRQAGDLQSKLQKRQSQDSTSPGRRELYAYAKSNKWQTKRRINKDGLQKMNVWWVNLTEHRNIDSRTKIAKFETIGRKIEEGALPVVDADTVLTGIALLIIVKQSSDWYSAIDGS
jgi:hypothetical protein